MAIYHEDIADINLNGGSLHRSFATVNLATGDKDANRFGMRVNRDGVPVQLENVSCQAVFRDPKGNNIALTSYGTVEGNIAYVTLPKACYNYEGQFCLAIKLVGGGVTGTMRIVDGVVCNTYTDDTVAPTYAVPTYQEVLAAYDAAIAAVDDVNELKTALVEWSSIVNNVQYYGIKAHSGAPSLVPNATPTYYVLYNSNTEAANYKRIIYYNGSAWAYFEDKTIDDLPKNYTNQETISDILEDKNDLRRAFEFDSGIREIIFSSGYLNTTGTSVNINSPVQSNNWRYAVIQCSPGDVFSINAEGGNSAKPYAFLRSDKTILYLYPQNTITDGIITIPSNCAYLIINDKSMTSVCLYGKAIKEKLKELDDLVESDTYDLGGSPLGGWVNGKYIRTDNTTVDIYNPVTSSSYRYTIIPCEENDVFTINAVGGSAARAYVFIDLEGNKLSVLPPQGKIEKEVITAPAGAKLLVINDSDKTMMCYRGDMLSASSAQQILETQMTDVVIDGAVGVGSYIVRMVGQTIGANTSNTDYKRSKIPIKEGMVYQIQCDTDNDGLIYAYFGDSTNHIISYFIIGDGNSKKVTAKAPEGSAFLFLMTYTESDEYTEHANVKVFDISNDVIPDRTKIKNHLTILIFGHSYTSDCWQYVPFILKEYGITCNIYVYYRGNGSIDQLVSQWTDRSDYGEDAYKKEHIRVLYHIDTRRKDQWDTAVYGYSAKDILEFANDPDMDIPGWDLITLQTAPTEVYYMEDREAPDPRKGYEPYVREAINLINASYKKPYVLGWFASYTRITSLKANAYGYPYINGHVLDNRVDCLRAAETIFHAEPFDMIIPAAAAVFNARTNASLASTSVSSLGNLWYADGVHLHGGVPCYVGNLAVVQALFKEFFPLLSVNNNQMRITDTKVNSWVCPGRSFHGSVKANTDDLYELAQKAAVCAVEHPFEITPIYDADDETEIHFYDPETSKYAADELIDTSNIDPDDPVDYDDGGEG